MGGRQHVSKSVRAGRQICVGLLRNMRRMVVHDQTDSAFLRIVAIQILEQGDELNTAVTMLDVCRDMTVVQIQGRQDGTGPQSLVFVVTGDPGMLAGNRK